MKKIIGLLTIIGLLFISCKKENTVQVTTVDTLAFGTSYGYCIGNCANFFLLENGSVYPDDMDRMVTPLKFKPTKLSDDKYTIAKELLTTFPAYLKQNPNQTFGCPDCHDQGAIYIEAITNGVKETWTIDTDINKQPEEIKKYVANLFNVVAQLK